MSAKMSASAHAFARAVRWSGMKGGHAHRSRHKVRRVEVRWFAVKPATHSPRQVDQHRHLFTDTIDSTACRRYASATAAVGQRTSNSSAGCQRVSSERAVVSRVVSRARSL
eukprot:147902-Rhodomonas_salina.1